MATFKPLITGNYPQWSGEMRAWLMRNGLWRLVKGVDVKASRADPLALTAEESKAENAWDDKAMKAAGELFLNISPEQRIYLAGIEDDPVLIWTTLESLHLQKRPGARFNAYDTLFSIHKLEGESLQQMMGRIDECMLSVRNLRPSGFTLQMLDDELVCMTMLRVLPEQHKFLATSLQLADKLEKSALLQAFITEDISQLRHSSSSTGPLITALSATTTGLPCEFCSIPGHALAACYRFNAAKATASAEVQDRRSNRRGGPPGGRGRPQRANAAQEAPSATRTVEEFAGSAATQALLLI
ncbi:hypothetical protein EUX98_g8150 [Antrodiella citrinella]|uniref:DUF4219 domain-containing protein n=1 Tax=Antrodiella citrinella TaxID=2447956 RepID=A0A4S4MAS3_9APHY|nr:hypothetical protein EUX98_g8150 [Antrodiella citrinella]